MDFYELDNNEKIYPLLSIEEDGKKYLFYSNKNENISEDDIFVGEELDNDLIPVEAELLPFLNKKYNEVLKEINK